MRRPEKKNKCSLITSRTQNGGYEYMENRKKKQRKKCKEYNNLLPSRGCTLFKAFVDKSEKWSLCVLLGIIYNQRISAQTHEPMLLLLLLPSLLSLCFVSILVFRFGCGDRHVFRRLCYQVSNMGDVRWVCMNMFSTYNVTNITNMQV